MRGLDSLGVGVEFERVKKKGALIVEFDWSGSEGLIEDIRS